MGTDFVDILCSVPVRRSRWHGFWVGVAAGFASVLAAAAVAALLLLSPVSIDGAWVIIVFAALCFALFLLSRPLQRRWARSLDSRRPGISVTDGVMSVEVAENSTLPFDLREPYELSFGWWEYVVKSTGGPTSNTRTVLTHATIAQGGRRLSLKAEDSVREALAAGWPQSPPESAAGAASGVRLWASDLVALVEALRSRHGGGTDYQGRKLREQGPADARSRPRGFVSPGQLFAIDAEGVVGD